MAKTFNFLSRVFILASAISCILFVSDLKGQKPPVRDVYMSQIGVTEHPIGSNWGPEVSKYLFHVNTRIPSPWCAAFVRFCFDSAGIKTNISAYSPTALNKNNLIYFKIRLNKAIEPGDVFTIYFPSMGRIGHTGFVDRMVNSSIVETVEGNSNNLGGREGFGVFKRRRPLHSLYAISRFR